MRKTLLVAAGALGLLCTPQVFAMGGGGGGSPSGYGGASSSSPGEYKAALKLIDQKKYAESIPHLEAALAKKPKDADILNYLGFTQRMIGNYPQSLDYYTRALAINPDHKGAHEYLGELYLNMKDVPKAQGQLAELARLCPDSCTERDTLTKSIADYQAANPAG